jgi:hypothetical protein
MTLVACLAILLEGDFAPYYEPFLVFAKQVLAAPRNRVRLRHLRSLVHGVVTVCFRLRILQALNLLRGKTMESVGLILNCLPPEVCKVHAEPIVLDMIRIQAAGFDDDDEDSYRYMTVAFSRLAECMGDDFAPYMKAVLPPIIETASMDVEVTVVPVDDDDEGEDDDDIDSTLVYVPDLGKRRLM